MRQDSSGRVISPTLRPLPDNTQHCQDIHDPFEFEPVAPASERAQNHALDRAASEVGMTIILSLKNLVYFKPPTLTFITT